MMSNRILRRFDVKLVRSSKRTHHDEIWRPLSDLIEPAPEGPTKPFCAPFLKGLQGSQIASLQQPADFAVVMPTVLQPTAIDAIQSVFNQRFDGAVQLLIGIDTGNYELAQSSNSAAPSPTANLSFSFILGTRHPADTAVCTPHETAARFELSSVISPTAGTSRTLTMTIGGRKTICPPCIQCSPLGQSGPMHFAGSSILIRGSRSVGTNGNRSAPARGFLTVGSILTVSPSTRSPARQCCAGGQFPHQTASSSWMRIATYSTY